MTIVSTPYAFAALRRDGSIQVASYLGNYLGRYLGTGWREKQRTMHLRHYLLATTVLPLQAWGSISWGGGEGAPTDSGYSRFALSTSGGV